MEREKREAINKEKGKKHSSFAPLRGGNSWSGISSIGTVKGAFHYSCKKGGRS